MHDAPDTALAVATGVAAGPRFQVVGDTLHNSPTGGDVADVNNVGTGSLETADG
jgi:hypothetical protein